jgi:hypothetical protein
MEGGREGVGCHAPGGRAGGEGDWCEETRGWIIHESGLRGFVRFLFFEEKEKRGKKREEKRDEAPSSESGSTHSKKEKSGGGTSGPGNGRGGGAGDAVGEGGGGDKKEQKEQNERNNAHEIRIRGTRGVLIWNLAENALLVRYILIYMRYI